MQELTMDDVSHVGGAMSDFTAGGMVVIGIGFAGGPLTGAFGLLVGGAMLIVGHYQK